MQRLFILSALLLVLTTIGVNAQWINWMNATYVIGQPNFTSTGTHQGAQGLYSPSSIAIDLVNNKLYISDNNNNRVLRYSYPLTGNQPTAELVFGQVDFESNFANGGKGVAAANRLNGPTGLAVRNGTLWVADQFNNRVLRFDNAHLLTTNGPDANGVLGQDTMIRNTLFDPSQRNTSLPRGIAIDSSGTLWVGETQRNRVLRFDDAANKPNGANADGVLGQADFTTRKADSTRNSFNDVYALAVDRDGRLWVADRYNNRIVWFNNAATKPNGADADGVLGQPDFTTNDPALSQNGLREPFAVSISPGGRLFVGDGFNNNRVLIYNNAATKPNGANADYVLGQPDFTTGVFDRTQRGMRNVHGLATSPDGKLFVVEYSNNRVTMFQGPADAPSSYAEDMSEPTTEVRLYPNPSNSTLTVGMAAEAATIEIYSVIGEKVYSWRRGMEGGNEVTIAIGNLPAGHYSCRVASARNVSVIAFSIVR